MQMPKDAVLLRIFFGEDEKCRYRPLYEAIVVKAREMRLAGATVLRGPMGFGHSSRLHTAKILRLSEDLPLVVEIVDSEEKINAFLPVLDGMISSGLVTLEKVKVLQYGSAQGHADDKLASVAEAFGETAASVGQVGPLASSGWARLAGVFARRRPSA